MALFNLLGGGISFKERPTEFNNLKRLNGVLKYPSDLGSTDKGHYILIQVNEQINTSFPGTRSEDSVSVQRNSEILRQQYGNINSAQGIAQLAKNAGALGDIINKTVRDSSAPSFVKEGFNQVSQLFSDPTIRGSIDNISSGIGVRTVRKITDSIALYMPDTLNFTYNQAYSTLNPGGSMTQTALSVLNSAVETYKNSGNKVDIQNQLRNASPFLANYFLRGNDVGKILFVAGSGGKVENPMKEILYSSPDFRSFRFDFLMMPRSEKEAFEVQENIELLKFHQAPEIVRNSGGFFMFPPSEFDTSFQYNGKENVNIPKISTCVLTQIDTDYAPGGFAAYEVEGELTPSTGRTGMPVAIRLTLGFTETEYLVKGSPLLSEKYNSRLSSRSINSAVANDTDAMASMAIRNSANGGDRGTRGSA